jgi:dihydroorotate dehydrogenase
VARVKQSGFWQSGGILGLNIGKNATTPIESAADDYLICMRKVYDIA